MATSGSLTTSKYNGRYYKLAWERTKVDEANNKSTIEWTLSALGGDASYYAERTLNVVIAGQSVFAKTSRVTRYKGEIDSGTLTITHNTDGSKSFDASIEAAVYYTYVNCTGSKTFTLDTIPRKSTLSITGNTLGVAPTLKITEQVSTFKHKIKYECGTASGWILGSSTSTSTDLEEKDWKPPITLAKQNTKGKSVSIKFILYTYTKGGTLVGSREYTKSFTIPEDSTKPTLSISFSDPTGYYSTYGIYVQGKSKVKITSTVAGQQNATISSCKAIFEGKTYSTNPATSDIISSSGNGKTISVTAEDSRGYTTTVSSPIDVCAYSKPTITFTPKRSGQTLTCTYKPTFASVNGKNNAAVKIYVDGVEKTTITNVSNNTSQTATVTLDDADTTYKVYAKIVDALGESASAAIRTVIGGTRLMNASQDGTGVAFGKKSEEKNCLESGNKIWAWDNIYLKTNAKGIFMSIPNGTTEPVIYKNTENLWIGATSTENNHITGGTFISAGDKGSIYVNKSVDNIRTNYKILDAENYKGYLTHLYHYTGTDCIMMSKADNENRYFFRPTNAASNPVALGSSAHPFDAVNANVLRTYDPPTSSNSSNTIISGNNVCKYSSSSRRYKHAIAPIASEEIIPERLYDAEVVQFKYNDSHLIESDIRNDVLIPGFIVEDLAEVYPIAIDYNDEGLPEMWNAHIIIPPMLKLIQDQKKEIDELKERLDNLESAK